MKYFGVLLLSIGLLSILGFSGCSIKQAGRFMGTVERSGCHTFGCR